MWRRAQSYANVRKALEAGVLKILSKIGISLLSSYHGAQIFEAIGIGDQLVETAFRGTPSRVGGLTPPELAEEVPSLHFITPHHHSTAHLLTITSTFYTHTPFNTITSTPYHSTHLLTLLPSAHLPTRLRSGTRRRSAARRRPSGCSTTASSSFTRRRSTTRTRLLQARALCRSPPR